MIKNKKRENMHTNRCGNTRRQKCCAKGSGKDVKVQEFMYRDTTNVEPEMYDYKNVNAGKRICVWHGLIIRKLSTGCHTVG